MKRSEILIIINIIVLIGICGFSVLIWTSTINSYDIIEKNKLNTLFSHTLTGIESQEQQIISQARDYAWWDDTYQYILGEYPEYITDNFEGFTLENLNIHLILYVDAGGTLSDQVRMNPEIPLVENYDWDTIGPLLTARDENEVTHGLITLNETTFLLCGVPILHTDSTGPIAGTLVFGRKIDGTFLSSLEEVVHHPITFGKNSSENFHEFIIEHQIDKYPSFQAFITGEDEQTIENTFYTLSSDGKHLLSFGLTRPKTVAIEGREIIGKTLQVLLIFTFLYLLIITIIIMLALSRYEVTRSELENKNQEIWLLEERKRVSDTIEEILRLILQFTDNSNENIQKLVTLTADLLHGDCIVYTKKINGEDILVASSHLPDMYVHNSDPSGKVYTSILGHENSHTCLVQSPISPELRLTDPLVQISGYQSFFGCTVHVGSNTPAFLSVYYLTPYSPEDLEGAIFHLIIRAIEVEEARALSHSTLLKRDQILESVTNTAATLINQVTAPDFHTIFRMLGQILHVTRVYIRVPPGIRVESEHNLNFEPWIREDESIPTRPLLPHYLEWGDDLADWVSLLKDGECIAGSVHSFSGEHLRFLQRHGIMSLALFPIFKGKKLLGILVFEDTGKPHEWILPELKALMTAATLIGSALERFEIENLNDLYTRQLAEKSHELALMNVEIQERTFEVERLLDRKNELITQIGHDIRTPLTPIIGLLPLIKAGITEPKISAMIELVETGADRIRNLLDKITFLRQLQISEGDGIFGFSDIYSIAQKTCEKHHESLHLSEITLENSIQQGLVAYIPEKSLNVILDELLRNAIQFTPVGGKIRLESESDESSIIIIVSDSGIGLSQTDKERIFEDFYKADSARHSIDTHGLGLSIVKRIVEKYGGTISAYSDGPGQGTSIRVTLPLRIQ